MGVDGFDEGGFGELVGLETGGGEAGELPKHGGHPAAIDAAVLVRAILANPTRFVELYVGFFEEGDPEFVGWIVGQSAAPTGVVGLAIGGGGEVGIDGDVVRLAAWGKEAQAVGAVVVVCEAIDDVAGLLLSFGPEADEEVAVLDLALVDVAEVGTVLEE